MVCRVGQFRVGALGQLYAGFNNSAYLGSCTFRCNDCRRIDRQATLPPADFRHIADLRWQWRQDERAITYSCPTAFVEGVAVCANSNLRRSDALETVAADAH